MKTRITFTATLDVWDTDDARDPEGCVRRALLHGDKHAGDYDTGLGSVTSVVFVGDEE